MPAKKSGKSIARSVGHAEVRLGIRLRALRLEKGLSQSDLANKLGVSFQQIQKYEKGTNRIAMSRAEMIARIFGISVAHLMGDGAETDGVLFNVPVYKLAKAHQRLYDLNPALASKFGKMIDSVCDDLEGAKR